MLTVSMLSVFSSKHSGELSLEEILFKTKNFNFFLFAEIQESVSVVVFIHHNSRCTSHQLKLLTCKQHTA